jgi:hypothetical protein
MILPNRWTSPIIAGQDPCLSSGTPQAQDPDVERVGGDERGGRGEKQQPDQDRGRPNRRRRRSVVSWIRWVRCGRVGQGRRRLNFWCAGQGFILCLEGMVRPLTSRPTMSRDSPTNEPATNV